MCARRRPKRGNHSALRRQPGGLLVPWPRSSPPLSRNEPCLGSLGGRTRQLAPCRWSASPQRECRRSRAEGINNCSINQHVKTHIEYRQKPVITVTNEVEICVHAGDTGIAGNCQL